VAIFEAYRQRRANLSTSESVATLTYMEDYLRGGENWAQDVYRQGDARCLVGAAEYARVSSIDDAKHWLRQAIAERTGGQVATIEEFNDSQSSFGEIAAVVSRAKQLATANLPALVAPVEVIPAARLAAPSPDRPQPNPWADGGVIDAEPVPHETPEVRDRWGDLRRELEFWMFD
jgi:hypothetical protein